jgi:hypothetical protein
VIAWLLAGWAAGTTPDAAALLQSTLRAHGSERLAESGWQFTFRGDRFRMARGGGSFVYERRPQSGGPVLRLDNRGLTAWAGDRPVDLAAPDAARRGLNSVVYFASLPLGLKDPAVRLRRLPPRTIEGRPLPELEVRFAAEGGGEDHEDVFRYWIDPDSGLLRYLAYRFERGGGGVRFRRAVSTVEVGPVVFTQWKNYGIDDPSIPLDEVVHRWAQGRLPWISDIVLEDVQRLAEPTRARMLDRARAGLGP